MYRRRVVGVLFGAMVLFCCVGMAAEERPNILLAISDDQSFFHTSKAGYPAISTPAFDRIANEGVYFTHAITASPGCSPSRAALLTGRYCWQLEEAGTHGSSFPQAYVTYPDLLEAAGYAVGYTGKGWGPGDFAASGRTRNPAGPQWNEKKMESPKGIAANDYAANFSDFLASRKSGEPFVFWYGGHEPHRSFEDGIGLARGKTLDDAVVPSFLPDTPEIRSDLLDYCIEIEWFDQHLGKMIAALEEAGELDNTIIVVTSDNGMAFPRAKANIYEHGIRMPLAIRWGDKIKGGRTVDDLVSLIDLAPTFLEAAGVTHPAETEAAPPMTGNSLMALLKSDKSGILDAARDAVYSARERHSSSRYKTLGYPQRGLRTRDFLYVRNFHPERWPAGAPQKMGKGNYPKDVTAVGPMHEGYHDIDACPSLNYLVKNRDMEEVAPFLHAAVDHRPAEELFRVADDPGCLKNLADDPAFAEIKAAHARQMTAYLTKTGDPRLCGQGEIFETYPRLRGGIRTFPKPDWAQE